MIYHDLSEKFIKYLKKYLIGFSYLFFLFACISESDLQPDNPSVRQNQNPYYQNQQPIYQQPYQTPQTLPNYYQGVPSYYYQPQPYQQQNQTGGSRFYSNPYAIPPSNQYPNYYDSDQYYVPPNYYKNVEPTNNNNLRSGASEKF